MSESGPQTGPYAPKRWWGRYRGIVADNDDPRRLGRVKVRLPEVLGRDMTTDWASTGPSYGGLPETGHFQGLPVGTAVFVEFESGDVNRPLVTGTWWAHPKNASPEPPALTRSEGRTCYKDDPSVGAPKGEDGFVDAAGASQCQPASPLLVHGGPQYPHNQVLKTKNNGITVEVDDTPGRPRVQIYLGQNIGSWLELDQDGLSVRVNGKAYRLVEQDDRVHVVGSRHVGVDGDATEHIKQARRLVVDGEEQRSIQGQRKTFVTGEESRVNQANLTHTIIGDLTTIVLGNHKTIVAGAVDFNAAAQLALVAGGLFSVAASSISLGGGGSPATPPNPETPPVLPSEPSCPPVPQAPACPPLPAGN